MKKSLVATYPTLMTAEIVVGELIAAGFARADIGLAVSEELSDTALVAVTTEQRRLEGARQVLERHEPQAIDEREFQWRIQGGQPRVPDEDRFTAIDRTDPS